VKVRRKNSGMIGSAYWISLLWADPEQRLPRFFMRRRLQVAFREPSRPKVLCATTSRSPFAAARRRYRQRKRFDGRVEAERRLVG
jgi:hypothetical protein